MSDPLGLKPIQTSQNVYENESLETWTSLSVARNEGVIASNGALVVETGLYTGRCPKDKFIVKDALTQDSVAWGAVNQPLSPAVFNQLYEDVSAHLNDKDLFVFKGAAGADPHHALGVKIIAEKAWHALFANTLFIPHPPETSYLKDVTVIDACTYKTKGPDDGVRSEVCVALDLTRRVVLILGTEYAGEIKKSVFSIMNFLLPLKGVLSMHCSANIGQKGDSALFFGLSGTGKTTLSADPKRNLIGDDEHGWSDNGVFNFEGGCYAKCIHLSKVNEPQIWDAIREGSVLENVVINSSDPDYDDDSITENTRATYPLDHVPHAVHPSVGDHPKHIFFLTCDAFGVLPPIARLTPEMAMYHFLAGYTAKVAGTEAGVTEPQTTFSACFGSPFLPLHPMVYAELLGKCLTTYKAQTWLVNTGWHKGPYGVGCRMNIELTRHLLDVALEGTLSKCAFELDPIFNVWVPKSCPGIDADVLHSRAQWADPTAYDSQAQKLARAFHDHFESKVANENYSGALDMNAIASSGPQLKKPV